MNNYSYLKQALALAEIRRGFCAPNPAVGAVVVKDGKVISTGYHFASGHPHAEVEALRVLGNAAKNASVYVTLEPCCHQNKKTPPCTDLLIQLGVREVFYGFTDPNPAVAGKGAQQLQAAGISCQHLPLPEIDAFYRSYQFWLKTLRPFVTAKLAMSLDGKIAAAQGQRILLTGEAAQVFTHLQRKRSDAILTTAKTLRLDNPQLNARIDNAIYKKPLYVLDSELTTSIHSQIFTATGPITFFYKENTIASKRKAVLEEQGARCISIPGDETGLSLDAVMQFIGAAGVHALWVEAGGILLAALIKARLVQHAYLYIAPLWLGESAQSAFTDLNLFLNASVQQWRTLGQDGLCELSWC